MRRIDKLLMSKILHRREPISRAPAGYRYKIAANDLLADSESLSMQVRFPRFVILAIQEGTDITGALLCTA